MSRFGQLAENMPYIVGVMGAFGYLTYGRYLDHQIHLKKIDSIYADKKFDVKQNDKILNLTKGVKPVEELN